MKRTTLFLIFVVFAAVTTGGTYLAVPWLCAWAIGAYLADNGFPEAQFKIDALGLTEAVISDVDLGPGSGVRVRRVEVDYSPGRLAHGVIDGIRIERPELPLSIDAGGVRLGALDAFFAASDATAVPPLIRVLGPVTVSAGLLDISSPLGRVDAALEGVAILTDGIGSDANFQFALQHPQAQLSGRIRGILDQEDQVQLTIDIKNAFSEGRVAFAELSGAVSVSGRIGGAFGGGGSLVLQKASIDGIALGNVDVAATVNGKAVTGEFLMGGAGTGLSVQVHAATDDVFDPQALVQLVGDVATDGLRGPLALPIPLEVVGAMSFDVSGTRSDFQALPAAVAANAVHASERISGSVVLTHLGLAAASGLDAILNGELDLAVDGRGWRLNPSPGLHFDLGLPGREQRLELSFESMSDLPFLAGGPTPADPLRVATGYQGVFNGWFPVSGDVGGTLWPATTDGLVFEDVSLRLDPWQMKVGGLEVVAEQIGVRMAGPVKALELEVTADARFSGSPVDGVAINGGQISFAGNVGYGADGMRVYPEGCPEVRATQIVVDNTQLRPGPVSFCSRAEATPLIHAVTDDGGLKRIDLAAVLNSVDVALEGAGPYPLSGTLPRLDGTASFDAGRGTWWARFNASGGNLKADELDLALNGIDADVTLEGTETLLGARADIRNATIADAQRPMRIAPVLLRGKGSFQPSTIGFMGDAGPVRGPRAGIEFRYRIPETRGTLQAELSPWIFSTDGIQPQDIVPSLKGLVTDVSGGLGASVRIGWTRSRTTSTARITLDDFAFGTAPAEVAGVSGTIEIADLLALKTGVPQTLSIGLLDAGLPLSNGSITFELQGTERLRLNRAAWPVAGGVLEISDLAVPFGAAPDVIVANLKEIDAADLARNIDIDGLEADGMLAGSIPVRMSEDGPVIDNARIWSLKNGALRFRSQVALESLKQSGEMADMLARALSDFRYTSLQMSLDGPLSGDITATAKLDGANPALYDGKRIELNVTLQGALRDLLQSASVIQDLPGQIRDQMQGPSGKP